MVSFGLEATTTNAIEVIGLKIIRFANRSAFMTAISRKSAHNMDQVTFLVGSCEGQSRQNIQRHKSLGITTNDGFY